MSDLCNDKVLANMLPGISYRLPATALVWEDGNRGTCCVSMKNCERLKFCCIILDTKILCTLDKTCLVSLGLKGFCQVFFVGANSAALLFFESSVLLCSRLSAVCTCRPCSSWCPYGLYDSADYCWWCSEEGRVSDCIRAGTDAELRALWSHSAAA